MRDRRRESPAVRAFEMLVQSQKDEARVVAPSRHLKRLVLPRAPRVKTSSDKGAIWCCLNPRRERGTRGQ